jgi:hypothetical protein
MEINNDVKEYRTVRDFYKNKVVFITGGKALNRKICDIFKNVQPLISRNWFSWQNFIGKIIEVRFT